MHFRPRECEAQFAPRSLARAISLISVAASRRAGLLDDQQGRPARSEFAVSRSYSEKTQNRGIALATVFAGGVAVVVFTASCSDDFTSCEASRSCAPIGGTGGAGGGGGRSDIPATAGAAPASEGGMGGTDSVVGTSGAGGGAEAGAGGAGGAAPQPECSKDAECSDGLACNGTETCVEGVCQPGVAPCANPEPDHCDAVCTELNGAAACSVQGQDKDKDGHLSSACTVKPGDDCDDAIATVHPGAPEICDRLDNNCNGKIDLADGLSVSGTNIAIGPSGAARGYPAIAWATDTSVYGITYYDGTTSTDSDLYLETVAQTGAVTLAPKPFNSLLQVGAKSSAALTWGGDHFGVAWASADHAHAYFTTLTSAGVLGGVKEIPEADDPFVVVDGVARLSAGTWAVLSGRVGSSSLWARTVSTAGAVSAGESNVNSTPIDDVTSGRMIASGSNFVIGYLSSSNTAVASAWNSALAAPVSIKIAGQLPALGAGPNGYAIATPPTVAGTPPQFYAFSTTGAAACGPVNLADKNFTPAAIVGTAKGYLVVSSGVVRVQEVLANCTMGSLFTVDTGGTATKVGIAGSATGYGLVWQDEGAGFPKRRLFGPDFCN